MPPLRILLIASTLAAGCGLGGDPSDNAAAIIAPGPAPAPANATATTPAPHAAPWRWLPGFVATATADHPTRAATERFDAIEPIGDDCHGAGVEALSLSTDEQTVLASVAQGVVVLAPGPRDRVVASAPIAECGGSEDATVALAIGDAWIGRPVIAVVATIGGHRASETDLVLYALDPQRGLDRLYTGVLASRDGDETRKGLIVALPGALIERGADGAVRVLPYDAAAHRFVPPAEAAR